MKYKINELVLVYNTNTPKTIKEIEKICGVSIYYMTDFTSYSEDQILMVYNEYQSLCEHITINKSKIIKLIDTDSIAKNLSNFVLENRKLIKEQDWRDLL